MSHRNLSISECGMVESVILFAFPHLELGFFFSTYRFLIRGVIRNYKKSLLYQIIQPKT
jgi:hypothetical protein